MKKTLASVIPLVLASTLSTTSVASDCGDISIAEMNWSSASLIANVDRFILEHGYDCNADLIAGDTMPTGTSMIEKGAPDIAPELWGHSLRNELKQAVKEKRVRYAGKALSDGGEEGFWVPAYMVEKDPSLATIEGIKKNAKLFEHPEDPDRGAFYGCPAGWGCQISSGHLFDAMKLEDAGFDIVDPGSSAGLSGSIAKAYERKEGWFGYYWAPTAVLGKYKMVKVDFGSGVNEAEFARCLTQEDCLDPKVSMYPPSPVDTVTTEKLASTQPEVFEYLSKRSFTNQQMNNLLAWMEDNQADGEAGTEYFLLEHEAIWTQWLSPEVAKKVKAAL